MHKQHERDNISIALVGNPNCGKSTVFNALTGARQKIGNWPGVTVERKSGHMTVNQQEIEVVDLPGIYSLAPIASSLALDEQIALNYINEATTLDSPPILINIVDASALQRHLYLTTQLLELGLPTILVLNMIDVATANHVHIDTEALKTALGCPVITMDARKQVGIDTLKSAIMQLKDSKTRKHDDILQIPYPIAIQAAAGTLSHATALKASGIHPIHALEGELQTAEAKRLIDDAKAAIVQSTQESADVLIADARYQSIQAILTQAQTTSMHQGNLVTRYLDNIFLNRFLGIPIFFAIMYALFFFSINIGGAFQDFFDIASEAIFINGFTELLHTLHAPNWLIVILANGIGKGINTTITFIPVIGAMFLFLSFLEDSGYMARAAFIVDRAVRTLGLPGKAFVPMIVGFGCNVPAIMGARTLENPRDRIITIMMAPFMSCGARLAIFAIFTAAFFPHNGQNVIFALYLIGIAIAVLTGFLLRETVLQGEPAPLIMELPTYHLPKFKALMLHTWHRLKGFILRAGRLIVPICMIIGVLNTLNVDGSLNNGEGDVNSLLSQLGLWLTPLFSPMGIRPENWPATVGLITGILAKEVVIGTLNSIYSQVGHLQGDIVAAGAFHLGDQLLEALQSIPTNLIALKDALINPVLAKAPIDPVTQGVYGLMVQKFDGTHGAFAYLLFVLLYVPCVSTTAAILRELNRNWAIFSAIWMTGIAYGLAVGFYQAATFFEHPISSGAWLAGICAAFFMTIFTMRKLAHNNSYDPILEAKT